MDSLFRSFVCAISLALFVHCTKTNLGESLLPSELDTENSQVLVPTQKGQADGATPLSVKVILRSKDGTPIVRFSPEMAVLGEGSNLASCSTTDDNGTAVCTVTSDTPGLKALYLKNAGLTRIASVLFESVTSTIAEGVTQAPANGQEPTSISVNLRDAQNNVIPGVVPQLLVDDASAVVKCQPANAQGVATCQIFSAQPGVKTVKVIEPPIQGSVQVEFKAPRIEIEDARARSGGGVPASAASDSAAVLSVVVKDGSGSIAPGVTPVLTITGPGSNQYFCSPASSSGLSECRITSDSPGDRVVSVTGPGGYAVAGESVKVTFALPNNQAAPPAAPVVADNSTEAVVEVVLRDGSNNPLSGIVPHAQVEGPGTNSVRCEESNSSGVAKCYVRSDSSGTKQVVIQDPPVAEPAPVTFTTVPLVAMVPLVPAVESVPAIVKVALPTGASAQGTIPVLNVEPSGASAVCAPADAQGVSSCFVNSQVSSLYTVKVQEPSGITQTLQVGFADPKSDASVVTEQAPSDGTSAAVIQIQLKTASGIPRIGVTPVLAIEGSGETSYTCTSSDVSGLATCSITSTAYGEKSVKVASPLLEETMRVMFTDAGASISSGDSSLTAIAAGTGSSAKIVLHLENSSHQPRVGVTPELAITGNGAIKYSCLPSDAAGHAECTITASDAGPKTVRVLHPPLQGATTLTFNSGTRSCAIVNGQGTQTWAGPGLNDFGTCTVVSCNTNYSISGNACVADSRSCSPMPTGASVCTETWDGSAWALQTTTSCQSNYTLASGVCVANTRACDTLPNHFTSGNQTWTGSAWGTCSATACEYRYKVSSGACVAADVIPEAVAITNVTGAALNTEVSSDPVTITGVDVPIVVSVSGGNLSRLETKRGTGSWTNRGVSYDDVQSGDLLRVVTTTATTVTTHTDVSVSLGDLAANTWRVTTTSAVAPTGMSLAHTSGTNQFTLSWNGDGIGNGPCHAQYFKDDTIWTDLSEGLNCDQAETSHAVTLPAVAGWTNNFNGTGVQVRIVRDSDSSVVATLAQRLTCSAQTLPSSETSARDENCDGDWGNDADLSAPTGASFLINAGGASTGTVGVTLSVTCPTDATAPVELAFGDTATPSNWVTCSSSVGHTLIAGTGTKTVYMRFRDGYGNTTPALSQSIYLDQSAPSGGDFAINSGAGSTGDASVTLSITCPTDDDATVEFAFGNSTSSSNWAPCAASVSHALSAGSGSKTVYVKFRDGFGNATSDVTQTITLDTGAPTASTTYLSGWQTSTTVSLTTTEADSYSTIASCVLEVAEASLTSGSVGSFGSYASVSGAGNGCGNYDFEGASGQAYKFRYRATDSLGNASSWNESTSVVKIDTSAPAGGSVSAPASISGSSITVTVDKGSDPESGMSSVAGDYLLEVAQATLSGGVCGMYGAYADAGVSESAAATSYSYTGVTFNKCYKFRYSVKNSAGLSVTYTMASETQRAQDTLPDTFTIASQAGVEPAFDISTGNITLGGFDGPVSLSFSGNTSNAAFSIDGGNTWTLVSSGHMISPTSLFRLRQRSSSSILTTTTLEVTVGTGSSTNFVVTTANQIAPSSLSITHVSNRREFTVSWTSGNAIGPCRVEVQKMDGAWINVADVNCDANGGSAGTLSLPGDGWSGSASNWNGRPVRLVRAFNGAVIGSLGGLSCSSISRSSSSTPNVDENCNGQWDDSGGMVWVWVADHSRSSHCNYSAGTLIAAGNDYPAGVTCYSAGQVGYTNGHSKFNNLNQGLYTSFVEHEGCGNRPASEYHCRNTYY